jgi:hypothetical protein
VATLEGAAHKGSIRDEVRRLPLFSSLADDSLGEVEIPADGRLATDEKRQWRVLEHLHADTTFDPYTIERFYESQGWTEQQAEQDVRVFDASGLVDEPMFTFGGYPVAVLSSKGRNLVEQFWWRRDEPTARSWACRSSLIRYVNAKAPATLAWFMTDVMSGDLSYYLGKQFSCREVEDATTYLVVEGLLTSDTNAEEAIGGLVRPKLTEDKGKRCIEYFGGDVKKYMEASQQKPSGGHHFEFHGPTQVAVGDNNELVMNASPGAREILELLQGLFDLANSAGLAPDAQLYESAVHDVASSSPTGEPAKRWVQSVKSLAAGAGNAVMTTIVNTLSSDLLTKLGHLTH